MKSGEQPGGKPKFWGHAPMTPRRNATGPSFDRMQTKTAGRISSSGKSPVVKQHTLPTMPQRHMWLHRLLFFLDLPRYYQCEQQQQQQQRDEETTPVLAGRGLQLPPTAFSAGFVQPQVREHHLHYHMRSSCTVRMGATWLLKSGGRVKSGGGRVVTVTRQ